MSQYIDHLRLKLPSSADFEEFVNVIKEANRDQIIQEFKELKITPVTISITLTTLTAILLVGRLLGSRSSKTQNKLKKQKKKQKKVSKAQKANHDIQKILDFVEEEYVPQINDYLENYKSLKADDIEYKYKYFEEMLLKELMKLDGVDVTGNDVLRENRRKVIKFIQDHQKRLDAFKKDLGKN